MPGTSRSAPASTWVKKETTGASWRSQTIDRQTVVQDLDRRPLLEAGEILSGEGERQGQDETEAAQNGKCSHAILRAPIGSARSDRRRV